MFTQKKKELFSVPEMKTKEVSGNSFIQEALKKTAVGHSANGAMKYTTTGDDFIDQFGSLGQYRSIRNYEDISKDMALLYGQNPEMAVRFTLYLRTISRKTQMLDGQKTTEVQKGGGLKHESIMRMVWLNVNHRDVFWKNIKLFIAVGSWKDIFDMLRTDLIYNGWEDRVLDWNNFVNLIISGLENETTSEMVKKYLPTIKAKSKSTTVRSQANTLIGKFISSELFGTKDNSKETYKKYRKLKSSGSAHIWQKQISERLFSELDFSTVHGRALSQMVSSKFLSNHKLEDKYEEWINSQPVAKFTGYVHELAMKIGFTNYYGSSNLKLKPYQKMTINKQFDGLVELAKENVNVNTGMIVVRDTSGSMTSSVPGQSFSAYDVAKALGIYFGALLEGPFKNSWIEFASKAELRQYKEDNFVDKWIGDTSSIIGNTNFLSVANLFATLKRGGVSESDFPTGVICISDGEFDNPRSDDMSKTNFDKFRDILRSSGFSQQYVDDFKLVLWDIPNDFYHQKGSKFETFGADVENTFYLSGYDGSTIGFLLGGKDSEGVDKKEPKTAEELFLAAMNQTILNKVTV